MLDTWNVKICGCIPLRCGENYMTENHDFLIWNLLRLFHYIATSELNASVNWFQNWINFAIKFFHWVYKTPPWTWLHQKQAYKQATLNSLKAEPINKWDGAANVPHTKRAEELDIPVRGVTDKVLGWSDTEENVLRLLKITQIQLSVQN